MRLPIAAWIFNALLSNAPSTETVRGKDRKVKTFCGGKRHSKKFFDMHNCIWHRCAMRGNCNPVAT